MNGSCERASGRGICEPQDRFSWECLPHVRAKHLALYLSAALVSTMSGVPAPAATPIVPLPHLHAEHGMIAGDHDSDQVSQTWTVQNCTDHDAGSLRDIIKNHAGSGDIVDLSMLPTLCGLADSRITLTTGEIAIAWQNMTLQGPDPANGTVTISGDGVSRVFDHHGSGTLALYSLTITGGYYHVDGGAYGGCITSNGSVYLNRTVVAGCTASSNTWGAGAGGIYAKNDVALTLSAVSGNQAIAPSGWTVGGGVWAHTLTSKYSSISNNVAHDGTGGGSSGGGAFLQTSVAILASTIDHNMASYGSGLSLENPTAISNIFNSTISGNVANQYAALSVSGSQLMVTISNSTIAFNHSNADTGIDGVGGVRFVGNSASDTLTLQSTIVANNTAGAGNTPADLTIPTGFGTLSGADNLIIASNVSPAPGVITVTSNPKLGPLQFNGGSTRTHSLLTGSPAIDVGNANGLLPGMSNDQRGTGYPRTTGLNATVDIGAFQFDSIFADAFDVQ